MAFCYDGGMANTKQEKPRTLLPNLFIGIGWVILLYGFMVPERWPIAVLGGVVAFIANESRRGALGLTDGAG